MLFLFGVTRAYIGRFNRLTVSKLVDHGVYLDASWMGTILLPKRQVPEDCAVGDSVGVFIYLDSEDRYIATTTRPKAQVGEVACLEVLQVNRVGAFLDWGLPKDLLVPFNQQPQPAMEVGKSYLVYVHVDEEGKRIFLFNRASIGQLNIMPARANEPFCAFAVLFQGRLQGWHLS